jgi:hypothetical protein
VSHLTIPLLLVETLTPEMDVKWQLRRAETILKCIKGTLLPPFITATNTDLYHRHTRHHPPHHHSITPTLPRPHDRMHSLPHNHSATSTLASPT